MDFARDDMLFEFGLTVTIRIGQILASGIAIAFGALKILLRSRRRVKREAKEEEAALEKWLAEHPEDAALWKAQQEEQVRREQEAAAAAEASVERNEAETPPEAGGERAPDGVEKAPDGVERAPENTETTE